ncbi:MAG: sensor histidine kinase [Ignavibacteriae bacterium]|nr:sensor histidine kinase [Ignavibacteriota bacterium]
MPSVGRDGGEILIRITRDVGLVTLTMTDDGIGLPGVADRPASEGFGLFLVNVLSEQLGGKFVMESGGGDESVLTFSC